MTREEAVKEINKVFEPAFANYIITALTEGATASDKALEQEPCGDAVSREAVISAFVKWFRYGNRTKSFGDIVNALPPVTPARPKGKWIKKTETIYYCNQCGRTVHKDLMEDMKIDYPYCHCGAEMEGESE